MDDVEQMHKPCFQVDFNKMKRGETVLLCKDDIKMDVEGTLVALKEGLPIIIYEYDGEEEEGPVYLVAEGTVSKNNNEETKAKDIKWCCKIDGNGIRQTCNALK
ncbi:hypothetical protein ACI6Q2_11825 [Chitinophagaceae bacterium LWZ2-11]